MTPDACELLCLDLPHAEEVRSRLSAQTGDQHIADRARALADGTRVRVARALDLGGELCVCDLAWVCRVPQNLASHHVRILRSAGLAASRRQGKLVLYRLTPDGHQLLAAVSSTAAA